ncbi:serine threonine kinase [Trichoderma arundinaceum]|uniref:Serine threonine kinase n=1 Tax=Trichoderma arundinaceum TaxID=490622 RepID=A0A395NZT2_TRIAR|nr:serine threonine kinase [Trichoderma arundinaceum]
MGDGWITVGHRRLALSHGQSWAEQEVREREAIAAWDHDEQWPSVHKPTFNGSEAKRFDARLTPLDYLGGGAFGRVDKVIHGSVCLARKRIMRRRGLTIEDLRQEGLTMSKLDHRHVVKLVAAYMPRPHELCLLIWPAAVCDLDTLLDNLDSIRTGQGDRDDILARLDALELNDLSAIEPSTETQNMDSPARCPFEFLRGVVGCVARAMAYCHLNGVRHLDIKPSNILLKANRVYLADFGISKDVSGQDQTTIDGNPGTEKWRAPELYSENGSSMQLSDIYSLGLVYLNIATVLYNVRLTEFDDALTYHADLSRSEKLAIREEKLRRLLEKLTSYALVTPQFMFTYEGQETVRPRPLVNLIAKMISPTPRTRLPADKVDEKLSMIGGIHQIYHGECCKRPISWVEDKWDKKFVALMSLRAENDDLKKKIAELHGRDETYEKRLENARKAHEHDVAKLQALLKSAEEKCRMLEQAAQGGRRRNHDREHHQHQHQHQQQHRQADQRSRQHSTSSSHSDQIGLGLSKTNSTQSTLPQRPLVGRYRPYQPSQPRSPSANFHSPTPPSRSTESISRISASSTVKAVQRPSPGLANRTPSTTSLSGYALRSRGSGSKLPLPVTPSSRSGTPNLVQEQSLTDSSMASSIFSRMSVDTMPTPTHNSPAVGKPSAADDKPDLHWGTLPASRERRRRRPSTPPPPPSPGLSLSPSDMSSPTRLKSDVAYGDDGGDPNVTSKPRKIPSLQPMKSWAEVAKKELKQLNRRIQ